MLNNPLNFIFLVLIISNKNRRLYIYRWSLMSFQLGDMKNRVNPEVWWQSKLVGNRVNNSCNGIGANPA
jgi:hypothetical protein